MKRRDFIKTSAGFTALAILPGVWSCRAPVYGAILVNFRPYREGKTLGKVACVTPESGIFIHTFYDICPFSPSGRYLAVTKFPFEDREPIYGDTVDICIIDLENETIRTIYSTKAWCLQLGAHLNWGSTDEYLYTNDWIENQNVCVRIGLDSGEILAFAGPMYHIAPDESAVISFPLDLISETQAGYGVPVNPSNPPKKISGAPDDQGLWQTSLASNERKLIASLAGFANSIDPTYYDKIKDADFYLFHSKYNRQGTRILQVVRYLLPGRRSKNSMLFTLDEDGSGINPAITFEQWSAGGNHPNWHPDGERLVMNLVPRESGDERLRFVIFNYDGSDLRPLSHTIRGSGHPSVTPDTRYLVSDCYTHQKEFINKEGEVPIRMIRLDSQEEKHVCFIKTARTGNRGVFRIDPHPAWDREYKKVAFNGAPDHHRQVFIADLSEVLI